MGQWEKNPEHGVFVGFGSHSGPALYYLGNLEGVTHFYDEGIRMGPFYFIHPQTFLLLSCGYK